MAHHRQNEIGIRLLVRRKRRLDIVEINNERVETCPDCNAGKLVDPRLRRVGGIIFCAQAVGIILLDEDQWPGPRARTEPPSQHAKPAAPLRGRKSCGGGGHTVDDLAQEAIAAALRKHEDIVEVDEDATPGTTIVFGLRRKDGGIWRHPPCCRDARLRRRIRERCPTAPPGAPPPFRY